MGDIHYGIKISKKIELDCGIFTEPIYEVIFNDKSISLSEYVIKVKHFYNNLADPYLYQCELFVDIYNTLERKKCYKGYQIITHEQSLQFINGLCKMDYIS
jgi:hypothetical protein